MKTSTIPFYLLLLLFQRNLQAQNHKYANNWYFGNKAAVTFNSGVPVALDNSAMHVYEGCVSYSDEDGNLMFYSNGMGTEDEIGAVWNSSHEIMPNGDLTGLTGESTPYQSCIVVPVPGMESQFYLFTVDGYENYYSPDYKGVCYSIIDMTLDGGLGDVTEKAVPVNPSVPVPIIFSEKITATKHANGTDYWLVVHQSHLLHTDTTTGFYVYQITESGISSPYIQYIGDELGHALHGSLKITVKGDRLVFGDEVFDFDNSTGTISNPVWIDTHGFKSFSKSGNMLYVTYNFDYLYQFDLTAPDVLSTKTLISTSNWKFMEIQLGPDGKIYMAHEGEPYLGVINDPEIAGTGCNFQAYQVSLAAGTNCKYGLPNYIESDLFAPADVEVNGQDEIEHEYFSIYPNPAKDYFVIEMDQNTPADLAVYDVQGKKIIARTRFSSGHKISTDNFEPGVYVIEVYSELQKCNRKLIVE